LKGYTVTDNISLRRACIDNSWFDEGTNEQYEKLFYANGHGYLIDEIATIIWLCSDAQKWKKQDILVQLKELNKQYLERLKS